MGGLGSGFGGGWGYREVVHPYEGGPGKVRYRAGEKMVPDQYVFPNTEEVEDNLKAVQSHSLSGFEKSSKEKPKKEPGGKITHQKISGTKKRILSNSLALSCKRQVKGVGERGDVSTKGRRNFIHALC